MDRREVAELVQDSVYSAIVHSKNEILSGVQLLISSEMKKVTENQRVLADMQISKIADLSSDYKFKMRSNEEQFKKTRKYWGSWTIAREIWIALRRTRPKKTWQKVKF